MAGARRPSHASGIQRRCHCVQAAVCVVGGGSGVVVVMTHKRGDGFGVVSSCCWRSRLLDSTLF